MKDKDKDRFKEEAIRAVGSVLLFRESENGGSYGPGIDEPRAARLARNFTEHGVGGEQLLALLLEVAETAAKRAQDEADSFMRWTLHDLESIAKDTDSLRLYQYVQRKYERQK